ncbi:hypothetical protein FKM82_014513 [Ascaphus truei]
MAYQNMSSPVYKPGPAPESGGVKVFNDMVHSFLDLVQPNAFPTDLLTKLIKDNFQVQEETNKILIYEVGFLVALAIGILFIVLMPLVGLFFSCCRCCGNCGGRRHQKQTKKTDCKRRFIYLFLFAITLVILAGDVCAFFTNNKISTAVNNSLDVFNDTLDNMKTYINSVPKEIDFIISASTIPIQKGNDSILRIGPILGGMILAQIGTVANTTLESLFNMVNVLNSTAKYMTDVKNSFNSLQDKQQNISKDLRIVQQEINSTLTKCAGACSGGPTVDGLTLDANFSTIPDFSDKMKLIQDMLGSGIDSDIQKAYKTLNDIPETVTNQTRSTVSGVQDQLVNIKNKINETRSRIPVVDSLENVNKEIDGISGKVHQYKPDVARYDHYRWIVGICLCCVILLVVLCNVFGLLLGPCGHNSKADPTERSCPSNSGGHFFMAGAAFSFIFSWLLMLVVLVLFLAGGNSYTLICKPWGNQQLFKFLDTPNLINGFNLSQMLNIKDSNLSISSLYSNCEKNESLWTTLDLNKMFNLDEYLNISKYTDEVAGTVENTQISLKGITFINANQRDLVNNVSKSGIDTLNFGDITQQMTKNTTKTDLGSFANQLEALANQPAAANYSTELKKEADTLRKIQSSIDGSLLPEIASLNKTLKSIDEAQTFVDTKTSDIVKNNAFWFSLGWCTIFLIPSIILSVKLAKYYRRMKTSEVFE